MRRAACAAALVAGMLLGTSCGDADEATTPASGEAPLVVATTSIWADITANVACDGLARVEPIIPAGADAHSFEPSLAGRGRVQDAALIVANGLDLEAGLADTLTSARDDGAVVLTVADHVEVDHDHPETADDAAGDGYDHADEGDGEDGGQPGHVHEHDPHLWLDPHLVEQALEPLGRALVEEVGLDGDAVAACTQRYRDALAAVDAEVQALVEQLPPVDRVLVTSHGSFDHFAERYGFDVVGTIIPSTSSLAESNPAALEALARTIRERGVPAIFTDVSSSDRDARALAGEVGAAVVPLHTESLGGPGSGAETYLDLLRRDASLIVDALGGGGVSGDAVSGDASGPDAG